MVPSAQSSKPELTDDTRSQVTAVITTGVEGKIDWEGPGWGCWVVGRVLHPGLGGDTGHAHVNIVQALH